MKQKTLQQSLMALFLLLFSFSLQANHVKCKCPGVDARGTGESSCSASETNGQCTIAFNEFDPALENAALDALQKAVKWKNIQVDPVAQSQFFTRKMAVRLSRDPEQMMEQILVFSLVSLTERGSIGRYGDQIKDVHRLLNHNASQISKSFVSGRQHIRSPNLSVTLGCLAFRTKDFWIMYKAVWSESIEREQC